MTKPSLMKKYPLASAFILGAYTLRPDNLNVMASISTIDGLFNQLEMVIRRHHPDWNLDEIYYKGLDLQESIIDELKLHTTPVTKMTEPVIREMLHKVKRKTKFYYRVIMLTHLIGQTNQRASNED